VALREDQRDHRERLHRDGDALELHVRVLSKSHATAQPRDPRPRRRTVLPSWRGAGEHAVPIPQLPC
jgi:hypothetical protein